MRFDVELLLLALAPVFLRCIGREARHLARKRPQDAVYGWRDTLPAVFGPPERASTYHARIVGAAVDDPRAALFAGPHRQH
ncbi:hypothetical protein WT67_09745 [Burkholderia stagnalis]|uniref:Uncharacterized protein n=1 Tax=Burkholderia stagnalis TaxID=1503054 RepID=A0A119U126_9BURK|nr:hypothetical protein WT74_13915 [Burkholderia stagnalis]KVL90115.1 hypothetical protein WT02_24355 [Burkholderia stagnalis]KVL95525.1 hypothetical protein WT03_13195 [Burkholderia stagnalis]KVM14573.1 hypothetical protein WT04_08380 [Burkholderia stagnalis]KVM89096.1 hypothetical protein WT05_05795 [Burkholderia stagnalis]